MDDLISREAALNIAVRILGAYEEEFVPLSAIKALPSVDVPVRNVGKWIYKDDDDMRYDSYLCSECNNCITVDANRVDDIGFVIEDMKFCPNCGAKMS